MADLQTIRTKVRRLTRSLSPSQLTDAQINEYINTFVLYDFPEHLRLANLRETFSFYTTPYVDTYDTVTAPVQSPLYDFKNRYITVHPPVYIAGYQSWFCEDRTAFFGTYPQINSIAKTSVVGNGAIGQAITFTINTQQANTTGVSITTCILKNSVVITTVDALQNALTLIDVPRVLDAVTGDLIEPNFAGTILGTINYLNGQVNIPNGFNLQGVQAAALNGAPIYSETVLVQPSLPQALLFYDGKFVVRPVPDKAYKINMEVYVQPAALLADTQNPKLKEWWQYIAYGSSIKVFQDRQDYESVKAIMPEFTNQMDLIQRRTIVQQTSQRSSTIYTEQIGAAGAYGPGWWSGGGSF
jgi:hypothetical protein